MKKCNSGTRARQKKRAVESAGNNMKKTTKKSVKKAGAKKMKRPSAARAKKTPLKKGVISKKLEMQLKKMAPASEQQVFILKNGKTLKSMYDLVKGIEKMSDDIFTHHVTPYKNDFCAWIYHAFNEVELARLLANEKNKKNTLLIIREYYRK